MTPDNPQLLSLIDPKRVYYCCWCPRRWRGHAMRGHLERMHENKLAAHPPGEPLKFEEHVQKRARRTGVKDLPGQTLMDWA